MAEPSYERHRDEIEARYQQRSNTAKLPGLDLSRLQSFLDSQHPGLVTGPLSATLMEGGRSNLTYVVSDGTGKRVVRRPLPHRRRGRVGPAARDAFAATLALDRCAGPHEIVGAAMFLAGEQASYCTGAVVCLDGGLP